MRLAIVTASLAALALAVWAAWPEASDQPASAPQGEIEKNEQPAGEVVTNLPPAGKGVLGWPHTAQNPAGTYSWDGINCAGQSCVQGRRGGFMHNGYASGDVEIFVEIASEAAIHNEDGTAVTVAGHDALYRRIGARTEEWVVGIQGTTLAIRLEAKRGASDADLAEAHAIIDSMRTERRDTKLGFRLVFTLKTDDWDSG